MARKSLQFIFILLLSVILVACGSKKIRVEIPPQIDLTNMGTIGVVEFDVQSEEQLHGDVTLKMIQYLQSAQPGVPILELGNQADILLEVGFDTLDTEAVKAIGQKYAVDTLLTGSLEVTKSWPDVKFGQNLTSMSAESYVRGNLDARLRQARSGATVWSNGAHGKWELAGVSLASGSRPSLGMSNQEDTYKKMLQDLVRVTTGDFRSTYETRVVQE
jgi:hypothetical protein